MNKQPSAIVLACVLSGCAATQIQSIYRAPDFQAARIHKVLVVSIASTPEIRRLVEGEFVRQWKARGVVAVASDTVLPVHTPLDKAGIAPYARAQGFDSVLVNRLIKRKAIDQNVHVHQVGEPEPPAENEGMSDYFNAVVADPEEAVDFEVAVLTTNLYEAATEKKVWSSVSQTLITGDIPKRIRPFTKLILKNLYS